MSYRALVSFQAAVSDGTEQTIIRGQVVDAGDEILDGRLDWFEEVPDQPVANPAQREFVASDDPNEFVEGEPEAGRPSWEDPHNRKNDQDPNADTGLHKPVDSPSDWTPTVDTEPTPDAVVPDVEPEGVLTWVVGDGRGPLDHDGVRRRLDAALEVEKAKAEPDAELLEALYLVESTLDEVEDREKQAASWPESKDAAPAPGGEGTPAQPTPDPAGTPEPGDQGHDGTAADLGDGSTVAEGPIGEGLAPVAFVDALDETDAELGDEHERDDVVTDPTANVDGSQSADPASAPAPAPAPKPGPPASRPAKKVAAKKTAAKKAAPRS